MDPTITSTNPYSRLVALSKLGVVEDFARIRNMSVVVVGLGGIGSVAAEMLARCGIGKLVVFDYDTVELANMNRMFFLPDQVGMTKVDAAIATIGKINPDVEIQGYTVNICSIEGYKQLSAIQADLLLCCVDNYTARITINRICLENSITWMESGVSESAVSGHIQTMRPGVTACFECAAPTMVAEGLGEVKREGVCAASLPTTMSIIAGLLVQNALKFLLQFGKVSECLGYDALNDFFPAYPLKPNPHCNSVACLAAQQKIQVPDDQETKEAQPPSNPPADSPMEHSDNTWGIEVVEDEYEVKEPQRAMPETQTLSTGELLAKLSRRKP